MKLDEKEDDPLKILSAIEKTSDIIDENMFLKQLSETQRSRIAELESSNLTLEHENTIVLEFKEQAENAKRSFEQAHKNAEKYKSKNSVLLKENKELSFNYRRIQLHNSKVTRRNLFKYTMITISIVSLVHLLVEKIQDISQVETLEKKVLYFEGIVDSTNAKVTEISTTLNSSILKYQNEKNDIWEVKNYDKITNDIIKVGDHITVYFTIKYNGVHFNRIIKQ